MPHRINVALSDAERKPLEFPVQQPEGDSCSTASLYRYFQESPLEEIQFAPLLATFYDASGIGERFMLSGFLAQLSSTDRECWENALQSAQGEGAFFLTWPHHLAVGRKLQA